MRPKGIEYAVPNPVPRGDCYRFRPATVGARCVQHRLIGEGSIGRGWFGWARLVAPTRSNEGRGTKDARSDGSLRRYRGTGNEPARRTRRAICQRHPASTVRRRRTRRKRYSDISRKITTAPFGPDSRGRRPEKPASEARRNGSLGQCPGRTAAPHAYHGGRECRRWLRTPKAPPYVRSLERVKNPHIFDDGRNGCAIL